MAVDLLIKTTTIDGRGKLSAKRGDVVDIYKGGQMQAQLPPFSIIHVSDKDLEKKDLKYLLEVYEEDKEIEMKVPWHVWQPKPLANVPSVQGYLATKVNSTPVLTKEVITQITIRPPKSDPPIDSFTIESGTGAFIDTPEVVYIEGNKHYRGNAKFAFIKFNTPMQDTYRKYYINVDTFSLAFSTDFNNGYLTITLEQLEPYIVNKFE